MGTRIEFYSRIANQNFEVDVVNEKGEIEYEVNPLTGQPKFAGSKRLPRTMACKFYTVDGIPTKKGALSVFQVIIDPEEPYHKELLRGSNKGWELRAGLLIGTEKAQEDKQFQAIVERLYKLALPDSGSSIMTEEAYRKTENPEAYAKALEATAKDAEIARLRQEVSDLKSGKASSKAIDEQQRRLKELESKKDK